MNNLIIGSSAIKYWFPDFPREPKDLDLIIPTDNSMSKINKYDYVNSPNVRVELLHNQVLIDLYKNNIGGRDGIYVLPNDIYTLKLSHLCWDINWNKHIWDVQWLRDKGCVIDMGLFYELYNYWNIHLGHLGHSSVSSSIGTNTRSNLNMSASEFFNNAITYKTPHDQLHELLITHPYFNTDIPTYKLILSDDQEVLTDECKFNNLTEEQKLNLTIEEVMVMAIERYSHWNYKKAFSVMLKKFIINHAPLWQVPHVIENHKHLITNIPFNYIKYINKLQIT